MPFRSTAARSSTAARKPTRTRRVTLGGRRPRSGTSGARRIARTAAPLRVVRARRAAAGERVQARREGSAGGCRARRRSTARGRAAIRRVGARGRVPAPAPRGLRRARDDQARGCGRVLGRHRAGVEPDRTRGDSLWRRDRDVAARTIRGVDADDHGRARANRGRRRATGPAVRQAWWSRPLRPTRSSR